MPTKKWSHKSYKLAIWLLFFMVNVVEKVYTLLRNTQPMAAILDFTMHFAKYCISDNSIAFFAWQSIGKTYYGHYSSINVLKISQLYRKHISQWRPFCFSTKFLSKSFLVMSLYLEWFVWSYTITPPNYLFLYTNGPHTHFLWLTVAAILDLCKLLPNEWPITLCPFLKWLSIKNTQVCQI